MTDLQIRDARPSDRDTILTATLAAYEQYAPALGPNWLTYRQNIVESLTNPASGHQIVAEVNGALVGAVLLIPAGTAVNRPNDAPITLDYPEIRLLAVVPSARGLGVGKALVDECVRRTRETGVSVITLHTTDLMQVAMKMYERMGFVRDPERDFHPAPNTTVKAYRLNLE